MTRLRPTRSPSLFDSRILGGYVVMPTVHTLRAAKRDSERLDLVVDTLQDLERYRQSLLSLMDDSVIGLRERGVRWSSLERRTGLPTVKLRDRIRERLARRRNGHANPDKIVASDAAAKVA